MTNQSTKDQGIPDKSPKQTSRYLIYLANLFLNQSIKRLFRWKQISPPLKLETLIATFWVPETTKRPRCITVSENGSLNEFQHYYYYPHNLRCNSEFAREIQLNRFYTAALLSGRSNLCNLLKVIVKCILTNCIHNKQDGQMKEPHVGIPTVSSSRN